MEDTGEATSDYMENTDTSDYIEEGCVAMQDSILGIARIPYLTYPFEQSISEDWTGVRLFRSNFKQPKQTIRC